MMLHTHTHTYATATQTGHQLKNMAFWPHGVWSDEKLAQKGSRVWSRTLISWVFSWIVLQNGLLVEFFSRVNTVEHSVFKQCTQKQQSKSRLFSEGYFIAKPYGKQERHDFKAINDSHSTISPHCWPLQLKEKRDYQSFT